MDYFQTDGHRRKKRKIDLTSGPEDGLTPTPIAIQLIHGVLVGTETVALMPEAGHHIAGQVLERDSVLY